MMMILFMMASILFIISLIMMMMASLISKKTFSDREKNSPFECGFDPKSSARLPFSLQFFLIAIIFLIFDVEITLLMPLVITMKTINLLNYALMAMFFLLILLLGVYHEWKQGALNWTH
uniref:NADH-ubiquinone oxidoreductase chain 3 n=1 Tax=Agyrtodes labralis TaxID=701472 RepID=A0A0S2MPU3_9COLE|nr:NADH deshydrogenase subunit 3 [Agyrtodes labralis]